MNKNTKYLLGILFFCVWVIAIIYGFNKGKKNTFENASLYDYNEFQDKKTASSSKEAQLLLPKPLLYNIEQQILEPFSYSIKKENIAETLTIVDEKGNQLSPSQSDKIMFNSFSLSVLDHDLIEENSLKKTIEFSIEKETEDEEFYRGMAEPGESKSNARKPEIKKPLNLKEIKGKNHSKKIYMMNQKQNILTKSKLINPEHRIYTN